MRNLWRKLQATLCRVDRPTIAFIWLLLSGTLALLLGQHPELRIEVKSTGGQVRLVEPGDPLHPATFYSQQVLPGHRVISVPVPKNLERRIRLDFNSFASPPALLRSEVRFLGIRMEVLIDPVPPVAAASGEARPVEIRLPFWVAVASAVVWSICASSALLLMGLWPRKVGAHGSATGLAAAWLVACFAVFAYQVIWSAPRLPHMDDWRYFSEGPFSLINQQYQWVTASGNDTYFLTGQIIDWALLSLFNGDFFPVRLVALLALAGFLSFAIALILRVGGPFSAAALVLMSLTLSSSAYWGQTGIAYHQMLPVLFFAWGLWLTLAQAPSTATARQMAPLFLLALAAGLAYISGPFLFISLGMAGLWIRMPRQRPPMMVSSPAGGAPDTDHWEKAVLVLVGIATLLLQLGVVVSHQGSLFEQSHAAAMTLPTQIRFWWFLGGLFGRAAGWPDAPVVVDVIAVALFAGSLVHLATIALTKRLEASQRQSLLIALSCGAGMLMYAGIVSAGRSGLAGPDPVGWAEISAYAKSRFHFWWLAALLPIYLAAYLDLVRPRWLLGPVFMTPLIVAVVLLKSTQMVGLDAEAFGAAKQVERSNIDCLRTSWVESRQEGPVHFECPDLYPGSMNEFMSAITSRQLRPAMDIFQFQKRPIQ